MPSRTTLTPNVVDASGLATVTFTAADVNGIYYQPLPGRVLRVKNAGGSPVTVTIPTPGTVDGVLAIADRTVSVAATTGDSLIAVGRGGPYIQPDGTVYVDFSAVASVTVALIDIP